MPKNIHQLLQDQDTTVCCLDNNQKGHPLKYQRFGQSNKFVKVTGSVIKECIIFDDKSIHGRSILTYISQKVPSPFLMPHYESLLTPNTMELSDSKALLALMNTSHFSTFVDNTTESSTDLHEVDFTGKRMDTYFELSSIAQVLDGIRRCSVGYIKGTNTFKFVKHSPVSIQSPKVVKLIKNIHELKGSLLSNAITNFQRSITQLWNPKLSDLSKFIIPPVSLHDEIKTDGYGMALIELMTLVGILTKTDGNTNNERSVWVLSSNWMDKTMYICLDGLSLDRHRSFCKKLIKLPLSFSAAFEQSLVFQKALSRVIEMSGPLHMSFHMLQSIYILFGNLLLVTQNCIEWKKIKPAKVSDNYRLCEALSLIAYDEIYRVLWFKYIIEHTSKQTNDTNMQEDKESIELMTIGLSRGFLEYVECLANTTTDDCLKYACRFFLIMFKFKLYLNAVKVGDAVMMEMVENKFCGVFLLLDKSNYFELCLSQMEKKYATIPYHKLQEIRINSACRYKKDSLEKVEKLHVLDDVMENVNMWVKALPLGNDQESWVVHSPNVMLARQCINFESDEYRRGLINFDKAIEKGVIEVDSNKQSLSVEPRKNRERSRLYELYIGMFDDEVPGKVFSLQIANEMIESLTTDLKKPVKKVSVEENDLTACMDTINAEIASNDNKDTEDSYVMTTNLDVNVENNNINVDVDNVPHGSVKTKNDTHKLALLDVFQIGHDKMHKQHIHSQRLRKKQRSQRHDKFMIDLYDKILSSASSINSNIDMIKHQSSTTTLPQFTTYFRDNKYN